jgi:hypothetical protein
VVQHWGSAAPIAESNRTILVLFSKKNRTLGPYLAAMHRILFSAIAGGGRRHNKATAETADHRGAATRAICTLFSILFSIARATDVQSACSHSTRSVCHFITELRILIAAAE